MSEVEVFIMGSLVGLIVGLFNFTVGYQLAKWKYTQQTQPAQPERAIVVTHMSREEVSAIMAQIAEDKLMRDLL